VTSKLEALGWGAGDGPTLPPKPKAGPLPAGGPGACAMRGNEDDFIRFLRLYSILPTLIPAHTNRAPKQAAGSLCRSRWIGRRSRGPSGLDPAGTPPSARPEREPHRASAAAPDAGRRCLGRGARQNNDARARWLSSLGERRIGGDDQGHLSSGLFVGPRTWTESGERRQLRKITMFTPARAAAFDGKRMAEKSLVSFTALPSS